MILVLISQLEQESLYVIRQAFFLYENIAVLFSGGKDSSILLHLVHRVSREVNKSYELIHVDTGFNFEEILSFRDETVAEVNKKLIIGHVTGHWAERNRNQSQVLTQIISDRKYDVVFGGGRRDEDKARQKEIFFSRRQVSRGWVPEETDPEFWPWLGLKKDPADHFRVFPLNNWCEEDVWYYLWQSKIKISSLYFSHQRATENINNHGQTLSSPVDKSVALEWVRFRTIGDKTNSSPIKSKARTAEEILVENMRMYEPERGLRQDDAFSEYSMEIRKREGYF